LGTDRMKRRGEDLDTMKGRKFTMNLKVATALLVLMVLMGEASRGQVVVPNAGGGPGLRQSVFGLGLFGGPAGGLGLSFRHHLPSAVSYQITGGIIKVDDKLSYDIGAEAQFDLARGPAGRFYAAAATAYFFSGRGGVNDLEGPGRVGLGVGGETAVGYGFNVSGDLLFTYFTDGTVLPLPQIGFHYYFR